MSEAQTQNQSAPASAAADTSNAASSNAGSDSTQTANGVVDDASAVGNSSSRDGSDGASDDGERNRPGRAERKIKDLTTKVKELQAELAQNDSLTSRLQGTPIDTSKVNLPDYTQMTEITPDQLKKDIITAATQIVDLKMATTASALDEKITRKDSAANALREIADAKKKYKVLNESNDNYDQELDERIGNGYFAIFKNDPNYSFSEYLKSFEPILEVADKTSSDTSNRGVRGTSANRGQTARRGQKSFEEMSTTEMEQYFASKR